MTAMVLDINWGEETPAAIRVAGVVCERQYYAGNFVYKSRRWPFNFEVKCDARSQMIVGAVEDQVYRIYEARESLIGSELAPTHRVHHALRRIIGDMEKKVEELISGMESMKTCYSSMAPRIIE